MEHPDYSRAQHCNWECALHEWRAATTESGGSYTVQDEWDWLAKWLSVNRKTQFEVRTCTVCETEILKATLEKRDPFKCPDCIKALIKEASRKLGRRRVI